MARLKSIKIQINFRGAGCAGVGPSNRPDGIGIPLLAAVGGGDSDGGVRILADDDTDRSATRFSGIVRDIENWLVCSGLIIDVSKSGGLLSWS